MSGPHGRLVINPQAPEASGVCDRCGVFINLNRMRFQYEWSGNQLLNQNFRFCPRCLDEPQPQLMTRILPPDPMPVLDARPGQQDIQDD